MNIIDKLREINDDDYFDVYFLENETLNWPLIPLYMDYDENGNPIPEDDPEMEPVDLENYKIVQVNDRDLIIQCGGDWQQPQEIKIILNDNDELEAISCVPCDFGGREVNMDELLGF